MVRPQGAGPLLLRPLVQGWRTRLVGYRRPQFKAIGTRVLNCSWDARDIAIWFAIDMR